MIRTSYRICIESAQDCSDVLDIYALAQVFKCAPAQVITVSNHGLPENETTLEDDLNAAGATDTQTYSETQAEAMPNEAIEELGKKAAKDVANYVTTRGKKVSAAAMNTYRETMAMRQAFGIAKENRTNIDNVIPGGLARILAEPIIEAGSHKASAHPLPKTQRAAADEAQSKWPRVLPALGLRTSILHRPLWSAEDPVARQNWKKVVLPQTINEVHELQRDLLRLEAPTGMDPRIAETLRFERLDLRFDRFTVSMKNSATNRFTDVSKTLPQVYKAVNGPVLGACDIARIDIPYIDYEAVGKQIDAACNVEEDTVNDTEKLENISTIEEEALTAEKVITSEQNVAHAEDSKEGNCTGIATSNTSKTYEEEPPSRERGIEALHLAEQSISSIRATELSVFAPASAMDSEENSDAHVSGNSQIWGIILLDGTLRYYDYKAGAFCEKPVVQDADTNCDNEDSTVAVAADSDIATKDAMSAHLAQAS